MASTTAPRETTITQRAPCTQQERLDRTVFALDAADFLRFTELLEAPLDERAALTRLLSRRATWEPADR